MMRDALLLVMREPKRLVGRLRRAEGSRLWSTRLPLLVGLVTLFGIPLTVSLAFPEAWWVERRFALRADPATAVPFSSELALVALDERFTERYDHPETTSKAYLAQVVRALALHHPTCIALDFRFGPSDVGSPEFAAFVAAAQQAADSLDVPLVYPALLGRPGGELDVVMEPPAALAGTGYSGSVSRLVPAAGPDAAAPPLREADLLTPLGDGRFAASMALVAVALQQNPSLLSGESRLRSVRQDSSSARRLLDSLGLGSQPLGRPILVDFAAPPLTRFGLAYLSSEDLLRAHLPADSLDAQIENRIVIVAQTAARSEPGDVVRTPFGVFRGGLGHLHIVDTLLRGSVLRTPGRGAAALLALVLFGVVAVAWTARFAVALALTVTVGFAYVVACFLAFTGVGVLVPMAWPLDAGLVAAVLGFVLHARPPRDVDTVDAPPPRPARRVLRTILVGGAAPSWSGRPRPR